MSKKLPYHLEAVLASHAAGPLPPAPKNRRPFVQRTIERFWLEEKRTPGHWHYSATGTSARVLAAHFAVRKINYELKVQFGVGVSIRIGENDGFA